MKATWLLLLVLLTPLSGSGSTPAAARAVISSATPTVLEATLDSRRIPTSTPFVPTAVTTPLPSTIPATLFSTAPLPTQTAQPVAARPWRIMPLGDSLTSGTYPGRVHSYRGYLETLLREAGYSIDFVGTQSRLAHAGSDPEHEGHSGYSIGPDLARFCDECETANLYDHLTTYLQSKPDVILLLIGINDLLPLDVRPVRPADAPDKLANLVHRIQQLSPDTTIFVASLAPISYMDSNDLPYYNEINQMAERLGNRHAYDKLYFVDLNQDMGAVIDLGLDFADGVHLAEGGARKMAQVWFEALVASGVLNKVQP